MEILLDTVLPFYNLSDGDVANTHVANDETQPSATLSSDREPIKVTKQAQTIIIGVVNELRGERIAHRWRAEGYEIVIVTTGSEVLWALSDALLDKESNQPVFMILEDILPGVLGRTIIDGVRDMGWKTPIVLLDGRSRYDDAWTFSCPQSIDEEEVISTAWRNLAGPSEVHGLSTGLSNNAMLPAVQA